MTESIFDSVNHTRFPKEDHLPDCASRDSQVKKGDRVECPDRDNRSRLVMGGGSSFTRNKVTTHIHCVLSIRMCGYVCPLTLTTLGSVA